MFSPQQDKGLSMFSLPINNMEAMNLNQISSFSMVVDNALFIDAQELLVILW